MKARKSMMFVSAAAAAVFFLGLAGSAGAADDAAAKTLAKQSGCLKCHAEAKKKDGPAYKEVAEKYKGKADAVEKLTKHITTGPKVKFEDGHEEEHKIVKTKDAAQIQNLVEWILSR